MDALAPPSKYSPDDDPRLAARINGPMPEPQISDRPYADRYSTPPLSNHAPPPAPMPALSAPHAIPPTHGTARSFSRSPVRNQTRAASGPALLAANHAINTVRANPVIMLPSRQRGSVKDIANKFNQGVVASGGRSGGTAPPTLTVKTSTERSRRSPIKGATSRSPVGTGSARGEAGMVKLQKRRPGQPRSPQKSPVTSFDANSSFSSAAARPSVKSSSNGASRKPQSPTKPAAHVSTKPLFGELTADGWHGNFDFNRYAPLPNYQPTQRRSSESSIALGHGRSQSHHDMTRPALSPPRRPPLHHKRSQSDVAAPKPQQAPSMPELNIQHTPSPNPTPPTSGTRNIPRKPSPVSKIPSPSSRTPVGHSRGESQDSAATSNAHSRPASALSAHGGPDKSSNPPPMRQAAGKENSPITSAPRSRYQPPPTSTSQSNQMLSAKIVAPLPKTSPPLRSSRPRQPVSSATTSASRARAAERFQSTGERDERRPSEQWLGKPYDAQRERSKRKIPELGKVDFAERRARIQRAISQNLEETRSQDSLKEQLRKVSRENEAQEASATLGGARNSVDQHQAEEMDRETKALEGAEAVPATVHTKSLSLDTAVNPEHADRGPDPTTGVTEIEDDDGTTLPPQKTEEPRSQPAEPEVPITLSSATYQPHPANPWSPAPIQISQEAPAEEVLSSGTLKGVMHTRTQSPSTASRDGTEFADESASAGDSASDIGGKWGLPRSVGGDRGSIDIMLDEESHQDEAWPIKGKDDTSQNQKRQAAEAEQDQEYRHGAFTTDGYMDSPIEDLDDYPDKTLQDTPRRNQPKDRTLKPVAFQPAKVFTASSGSVEPDPTVARVLDQYRRTGVVAPEMFEYMQRHSIDLQRASANAGSDAIMIQNLMDSMVGLGQAEREQAPPMQRMLTPMQYEMPAVTPDTPPDAAMANGTAVVFTNISSYDDVAPEDLEGDDEFRRRLWEADEAWERQQRDEDAVLGALVDHGPTPPPKDIGYTPRSSTGPDSTTIPHGFSEGLRISTADTVLPGLHTSFLDVEQSPVHQDDSSPISKPPLPKHAPPPPPSPLAARMPYGVPEVPPIPATYSDRGSSELSPRARRNNWGAPGSARPSVDSQRAPTSRLPSSQSRSSFADSARYESMDPGGESTMKPVKTTSPGPEQKRLMKRRHIIKELLDTENTYHQDLKIIEDIYKATVADLVAPEDKRTLFGNCDEIERFSLHFYDEMRRAVLPVYVPPKHMRWAGKRASYSTTHSDGTGATSAMSHEAVDDERDRATTVGQCFLESLPRMDQVYGAYLRNHDAANQRLSALKNTTTVKCWLDECHNNASDITSAWDLDSLLVKPTQRVSKYPMLLQQLLETTPADHPDHKALKTAATDSVAMLTRINEAKKRADIVDQIINRKGKETDVRSGIAKAFGRRTERLKERVGIAEVFQDPEFDELSHKFGGHFIRLQICMRDVQDYMHRIDRAMEMIANCAASLELYTDVSASSLPEIESKWRRYGQAIREISTVAFPEHKAAVTKRVIAPMVACIRLHDGPQNAINNRKKRIVDYAKCMSIEKRGEKPDRKTVEASEKYLALNDQLKIDLPNLYVLTASLVQSCLACFLDIQLAWYDTWEWKLRPILEAADVPASIQQIEPAFFPDYDFVKGKLTELAICNGALLADSANFLSPTTTLVGDPEQASLKRPSTLDNNKRTMSVGSDASPYPIPTLSHRHSSGYTAGIDAPPLPPGGRFRSSSSLSNRGIPSHMSASEIPPGRQWSNTSTPTSSFSASRPPTASLISANHLAMFQQQQHPRSSAESGRSPRPSSATTYFTAHPEQQQQQQTPDPNRASLFQSALPPDIASTAAAATTTPHAPPTTPGDTPVLFVCASLFEFSIDKTRREGGYPYLTYVQGEVFDVVAQKGELWLARNQDDGRQAPLGWIWEQHFVILSQD